MKKVKILFKDFYNYYKNQVDKVNLLFNKL